MSGRLCLRNFLFMISSKHDLEAAAVRMGLLPFFSNAIEGFSVEEMAAPGMLFGETRDDYGCWEWKGPVIQEQTTAYGKFFRRKAGFVAAALLPDFLNYRRAAYPVAAGSTEEMILDIVRQREGVTSTELKRLVFGTGRTRRPEDLVDVMQRPKRKRLSLEGPLQRLQMGGWLLIADFEYKYTAKGERYGWGVALYSTPEIWFDRKFDMPERTPIESLRRLITHLQERFPDTPGSVIEKLLR